MSLEIRPPDVLTVPSFALRGGGATAVALAAEIAARIADVNAEQARAEAAEGALGDDIAAETSARITDVNAEQTRAQAAEAVELAARKISEALLELPYEFFDSTTAAAPPNGKIKFNNDNAALVTTILIDYQDRDGVDRELTIEAWLKFAPGTVQGRLKLIQITAPYRHVEYKVLNVVDGGGYATITVEHVASAHVPFTDGIPIVARFQLSNDRDIGSSDASIAAETAARIADVNAEEARALAAEATKAPTSRIISTSGLATGGGSLAADRTITVAKATGAEVDAVLDSGGEDGKAVTPVALLPIKQAGWTSWLDFKFLDTITSAQPPSGMLKFDVAFDSGYDDITKVRISDADSHGGSRLSVVQTWNGMRLKITQRSNPTRFVIVRVTSQSHTDHTLLNVVHLRSGEEFVNDADLTVFYSLGSDADIAALDTAKAPLASPVFTGNPTAPTATVGDSDTSIANTAFVSGAVATAADAKIDRTPSPAPVTGTVVQGRPALQTSDNLIALLQFPDGEVALGPIPVGDWHCDARGAPGSRHVWMWAEGIGEFQVSAAYDGDDNFMPRMLSRYKVTWRAETAGTSVRKTAILAAGMAGLSNSVTEIRGIHVLGQSTSNGNGNDEVLTVSAPIPTRGFMPGSVRALRNEQQDIRRLEPLLDEYIYDFLPALEEQHLSSGETGWVKAIQTLSELEAASKGYIVSTLGIGSVPYDDVKLGTVPFANLTKLILRERISAGVLGRSYVCNTMWHPWHEGDASAGLTAVQVTARIQEAWTNYKAEIQKITGATGDFYLLTDGLASQGHYNVDSGLQTTPTVPWGTLAAALANDEIIAVCPRYFLEHLPDDVHPSAEGCRLRGEYFGRADFRARNSQDVLPVYMLSAVRTGAVILVTFNLWDGFEPLHFNDDIVTDPGNEGVEYLDTGGNAAAISSMVWVDVNQLEITLDMVPTGTSPKIRIASQSIDATGPTTGPRSRISDTAPDGLHNYAWPQEIAVTT